MSVVVRLTLQELFVDRR